MEISSEISNKITRALRQSAYGIVPGFLDPAMVTDLSRDIDTLEKEQMFKGAAVGRGQEKQEADLIRRDRTCWLDSVATTPLRQSLLEKLESLRLILNQDLHLGLFQLDTLYSIYEKGDFYRRHNDVFRNDNSRVLSSVLYLNENWRPSDGGELILYPEGEPVTVNPQGGTLVCFLSSTEHEVKETFARRKSCASWFSRRRA